MKTQHAILLSLFALLGLSSCEEDDLSALLDPQNSEIASRYVSAEGEFLNIYSRFESALRDSVLAATGQTTQDGATISWDASSMVLAIDFGASNVLSAEDGRSRRGKIEVMNVSPAFLTTTNTTVSLQTDGYHVDDVAIDLYFMVTNRGLSGTSEHFEIDSFALGLGAGDYLMTGRKDFYWDQGFNTIENLDDDIYRMNGFSRAQDFGDTAFIQAIYSPTDQIIVDKSCAHTIPQGIIDLDIQQTSGNLLGSVDFITSDGCNNLMRVTVSGISTTVPMPSF